MTRKNSSSMQGRATGPRTAEGRKRASQNARTHGLTAQPPESTAIIAQVEAWAEASSAGEVPDADLVRLAQARLHVARARVHQAALLDRLSTLSPSENDAQSEIVAQFCLSLRYRSEAEASARKALREVTTHKATSHRKKKV